MYFQDLTKQSPIYKSVLSRTSHIQSEPSIPLIPSQDKIRVLVSSQVCLLNNISFYILFLIFAVIITKNYILCTYNDNQVSLIHFTRSKRHVFDKISKLEPKISTIDMFGPNGRRLDKKVQTNKCNDLVNICTKFS